MIADGTSVVRALVSALDGDQVQPRRGFTRLYIHPGKRLNTANGLLTGLLDPVTSHLTRLTPGRKKRSRLHIKKQFVNVICG